MGGGGGGGHWLFLFVCLFVVAQHWFHAIHSKSEPNLGPGHPRLRLAICAGLYCLFLLSTG